MKTRLLALFALCLAATLPAAQQVIGTDPTANPDTGQSGGAKINANFAELYAAIATLTATKISATGTGLISTASGTVTVLTIGSGLSVSGTTISASGSYDPSNVNITNGSINGVPIGGSTPAAGNFTTLASVSGSNSIQIVGSLGFVTSFGNDLRLNGTGVVEITQGVIKSGTGNAIALRNGTADQLFWIGDVSGSAGAGRIVLNAASADDSSPTEGEIEYRTDLHHFFGWNGSSWKQLDN